MDGTDVPSGPTSPDRGFSAAMAALGPRGRRLLLGGSGLAGLALAWALGSALLAGIERDRAERDLAMLREVYEARVATLAAERDAAEAAATGLRATVDAQARQLAVVQAELLAALEAGRARSVSLAAVRRTLADTVRARDHAERERAALAGRLAGVEGDLTRRAGTESDLSETLGALSVALAETVRRSEAAEAEVAALTSRIGIMEAEARIEGQRMERAIGRIEEAVVFSLGRMTAALSSTGIDVDALVADLRRTHSGEGGPLVLLASAVAEDPSADPMEARVAGLLGDLEKAELMRLAMVKLPFAVPVKGSFRFTSPFGTRRDPRSGRVRAHEGVDFAGDRGTPITAGADGTVIFAGRQSGYGNVIKIRHAFGYETVYAHLSRIRVEVGDQVAQGDLIGDMGNTGRSTGVHLHYEVRRNGTPVNPMPYVKAARDVL